MKLADLIPNPDNPRQITEEAMGRLCESIKTDPEFMRLRPMRRRDNLPSKRV